MTTLTAAAASDLFRRDPDRWLDVGAGDAAYRRVGSGPDVLFVHGWPVSGATFRLLLPHLADHVTCHVIDFPSAGSSRFGADTTLSIGQHIETVRRVVDQLELDEIAVVGHDSGGLIARHAMAGDSTTAGDGPDQHRATEPELAVQVVLSRRATSPDSPPVSVGLQASRGFAVSASCSAMRSPTRRCSTASSTSSSSHRCTSSANGALPPPSCSAASISTT